jgi:hypothetical protein
VLLRSLAESFGTIVVRLKLQMTFRAPNFCSIVLVVVASAALSCSLSSNSHPREANLARATATPIPDNAQAENKPAFATEGEPYVAGDIKIGSSEVKEKNDRLGYELNVSCPQVESPRTSQGLKFNLYVRRLIEGDIKEFRAFCSKRKYPKQRGSYFLGTTYKLLYATPELLSVAITEESYTGYLNSDWSTIPLNYDLKAGKPLDLADLFKPRSKFLEAIASYCVSELEKSGLDCGGVGGGKIIDEHTFREGTSPKAENYGGWNLTRNGIQITFGEYQIGPGCVGLISVVVPFDRLKGILRRDIEWLRPAST